MKKYLNLGLGILTLLGLFFPVVSAGAFYATIFHLGGLSYLLVITSLAAIALSVVTLVKGEAQYTKPFFGITAGIAVAICIYITYYGMEYIQSMVQMTNQTMHGMERESQISISAVPGSGVVMMLLGYCGILTVLISSKFGPQVEEKKAQLNTP